MKTILIITTGIIIMILVASRFPSDENQNSSESGIQFSNNTWEKVLALAKKENKPIFLDISASWCGWCKKMKAKVYTDQEVAEFYNTNFINISVDAEKGEGIKLKNKYNVKGYPTFVFVSPDGSLAKQLSGYRNSEKFLELGKSISNDK